MPLDIERAWRVGRLVGKPLLMPTVVVLARPRGPRSPSVRTAQVCSWVGDVALIGRSRTPFLVGLSSFLLAHLAYVAAYRERSSVPLLATRGRRRLLLAGTAASGGMALAASRRDRALAAPVAAYGVTLAGMVTAAAAVDADRGRGRLLAGAGLFLVSDTLIGVGRFLTDRHPRALEAAVLTTYAGGQWLIASGLSADPARRTALKSRAVRRSVSLPCRSGHPNR